MSIRITSPAQAKALGIPGIKGKAKARERRPKSPGPMPLPPGRLLALDPSSTAVGWAMFQDGELRWVGVTRSASNDMQRRCVALADAIASLAAEWRPEVVVVEMFSGFHRKGERGGRINKATILSLARAQGFLLGRLHGAGHKAVVPVPANKWTHSKGKADRAKLVDLTQPIYSEFARKDGDKGLDGADAVGLGLWYLGGCR